MKLKSRLPFFKLVLALIGLQGLAIAFVAFRETIMLDIAQLFWVLAIVVIAFQLFKQRGQAWQTQTVERSSGFIKQNLKYLAIFSGLLFLLWQINYLSLYSAQPLMFSVDDAPVVFDINAGDLLGFTLKLGLQTWLLALALALIFNLLPRTGEYGFLRGNYKYGKTFVWLVGNFAGGAMVIGLMFVLSLLTLDVAKFVTKAAGADVINVPQIDLMLFMLALFLMMKTTNFMQKLKTVAQRTSSKLVTLMFYQMLFVFAVYCLFMLMMQFIPHNFIYELMQPFYLDFFDFNTFPEYWQLFATAISLFCVPVLAHYLYYSNKGKRLLQSVFGMIAPPVLLSAAIVYLIPPAQATFLYPVPEVEMFLVDLNNVTAR